MDMSLHKLSNLTLLFLNTSPLPLLQLAIVVLLEREIFCTVGHKDTSLVASLGCPFRKREILPTQ